MQNNTDLQSAASQGGWVERAHALLGGKRYYIETYGCQMNAHDSERLAGLLQGIGMEIAADKQDADLILLNTCCVREHAENRVYGNLGQLAALKREKPDLLIGVCGCMMQQDQAAQKLLSRMRHVNLAFGTHNLHELPKLLVEATATSGGKGFARVTEDHSTIVEGIPAVRATGVTAFTTIMYGCDNFCSYCIVPHVRGREKSRAPEAIVAELRELTSAGVAEITLLGQNVNSYNGEGLNFPQLLRRIAQDVPELKRLRFMTSHPKDLSDELVAVMAGSRLVCPQIHLPVQSGSDAILHRMNRKYTAEHYLELLDKLRAAVPGIGITSDFIVGFPGETEEDFQATLDLVERARLNGAFTFKYSRRSGTAAAKMESQIADDIKRDRLKRLNTVQARIAAELDAAAVGTTHRVLFESVSRRRSSQISGRTGSGRMVSVDGDASLIGQIRPVRITRAMANTLAGEILNGVEG